jgi:hypothetical protein
LKNVHGVPRQQQGVFRKEKPSEIKKDVAKRFVLPKRKSAVEDSCSDTISESFESKVRLHNEILLTKTKQASPKNGLECKEEAKF